MKRTQPASLPLFICMKWGTRYGPAFVNRLYRGVQRGMRGAAFQFICFTDDTHGVDKNIECRPLPPFEGVTEPLASKPWRKLSLWRADLGPDLTGRDALVLDIDLIITGNVQPFFSYALGCPFVVWRNPTKPTSGIGNTSVFRFTVGSHPEICTRFTANPQHVAKAEFRIEQELIAARLGDGTATQRVALTKAAKVDPFYAGLNVMQYWPQGWVQSFKEDLLPRWPLRLFMAPKLPAEAAVVVFHGKPDPDEALAGQWPAKGWKKLYKQVRPTRWIAQYWT